MRIARRLYSKPSNRALIPGTSRSSSTTGKGGVLKLTSTPPRLRVVALHDVCDTTNLPKLHTFLNKMLSPQADVVCLAGDFLSSCNSGTAQSSAAATMDGGRSMVAALKETGITHVCLGNREADLPLSILYKRLKTLSDSGVVVLNTNVGGMIQQNVLGLGQEIQKQQQALINELLPSYKPQQQPPPTSLSSSTTMSPLSPLASADLIHELLPSYEPQSSTSLFPSSPISSSSSSSSSKSKSLLSTNISSDLVASYAWLNELLPSHHVVTTPCGRVRVGLLGLLSDEANLFRDHGTFRGAPIHNVLDAFTDAHENLVLADNKKKSSVADWLLPMTHQSLARDSDLARRMLEVQAGPSIILGGHEHTPMDVTISSPSSSSSSSSISTSSWSDDSWVRIIKSATDARTVSLVDLYFDVSEKTTSEDRPRVQLGEVQVSLVDVTNLEPSYVVQSIVDSHKALQEEQAAAFEGEDILHAARHFNLPPNVALSSRHAKSQQTTVGAVLCTAIKEELQVDVALLLGSALHGNVDSYYNATMTYGQLKRELREPIKMVIVPMKRWQVQAAVAYSRRRTAGATSVDDQDGKSKSRNMNDNGEIQVQADNNSDDDGIGCLQVDMEFENVALHDTSFSPQDDLRVALPRNVLEIYCQIKQGRGESQQTYLLLHNLEDELHEHGDVPADDDFYLADQVITRHCSKYRWYEIIMDQEDLFQNLDNHSKGYFTQQDVKRMLTNVLQHEPSEQLVKDMMAAMDANDNEKIDPGEFSHLLAVMEQEHGRGLLS